jgi:uncharacterized membrane protein YfcA
VDAWLIDSLLGFAIGLTLGFLGGGGSILTVPALVYIVGQSPQTAVTASLVIVGANAAAGALVHRRRGSLDWRVALLFGGVGMVTAYLAAGLSKLLSSTTLLILFALLMLVVGGLMIFRKPPQSTGERRSWLVTIASGAGVGVLTGFLGVGGGFLIVPALVMLVGMPIRQAVGTSLVIIAMNSLAGLLGHLGSGAPDLAVILLFVAAGLVGVVAGERLARVLNPDQLRTGFAVFVALLGIILLVDNIAKLL